MGVLPWTFRSEGKQPSRWTGGQSSSHKRLASRKIWSVELETLPTGTKPRTSHHRSPGPPEVSKEEALDYLPWKDERGPSSFKRTTEPFQRWRWGNFRQTAWAFPSAKIPSWKMNWTVNLKTVSKLWGEKRVCFPTSARSLTPVIPLGQLQQFGQQHTSYRLVCWKREEGAKNV